MAPGASPPRHRPGRRRGARSSAARISGRWSAAAPAAVVALVALSAVAAGVAGATTHAGSPSDGAAALVSGDGPGEERPGVPRSPAGGVAPPASPAHPGYDFDANAASGSVRWQGQRLYVQGAPDRTYELREAVAVSGVAADNPAFDLAVADAGGRATVSVVPSGTADASFRSSVVPVHRGDVARIEVALRDAATATVFVGCDGDGYYCQEVAFEDGDRDGRVVLSVNTYLAGDHLGTGERAAYGTADGDDAVTGVTGHAGGLDGPLRTGDYRLNVTVGGVTTDVGALAVESRSTDALAARTAPAAGFGATPADATVTTVDRVALDDVVVAQIEASGIFGLLAAQPGADATARLRALVASSNASFDLVQTNPGANAAPLALDRASSFENGAFHVVADAGNDTLSVAMNESALRFDGYRRTAAAGDRFRMAFTLHPDSRLATENETVTATFALVERSIVFDTAADGSVHLSAADGQTFGGETTVAPGTRLSVVVESSGRSPSPFFRNPTAVVERDRAWSATVDLETVEPGTAFEVSAVGFAAVADGVVEAAPPPTPTATPAPATATPAPATATPAPATATPAPATATPAPATAATGTPGSESPAAGPAGTDTDAPATPTAPAPPGGVPGFGAAAAVLALLSAAVLALRRR